MLFTVIGTVSHELGHIAVARYFGYKTTLHFGSMHYEESVLYSRITEIYSKNYSALESGTPFGHEKEYRAGMRIISEQALLITMGGPVQTLLTGIAGLLILIGIRTYRRKEDFRWFDWLAVFSSLFWLREVFNVVMSVSKEMVSPNGSYFGGDEKKISGMLGLWTGTMPLLLGLIGLAVSLYVVFKVVPRRLQLTFIASGLVGGTCGFILWMYVVGPMVLPHYRGR